MNKPELRKQIAKLLYIEINCFPLDYKMKDCLILTDEILSLSGKIEKPKEEVKKIEPLEWDNLDLARSGSYGGRDRDLLLQRKLNQLHAKQDEIIDNLNRRG
jgi:hypothetical protein